MSMTTQRYTAASPLQCRARVNTPAALYLVASCRRRRRASRLDESFARGVPGSEYAAHHCLVFLSATVALTPEAPKMDGESNDATPEGFYQLQQQLLASLQTSGGATDRRHHELMTANNIPMPVFTALPPRLPSQPPGANSTKQRRYRSVSISVISSNS